MYILKIKALFFILIWFYYTYKCVRSFCLTLYIYVSLIYIQRCAHMLLSYKTAILGISST